jgi:tetratricopeptide (TPR) repeat protein
MSFTSAQAAAWFDAEWANLVAAIHQAAASGFHETAWQIPDALHSFASLRRHWADWRDACLVGRAAARRAHDPQAEAWMLTGVGLACRRLRRFEEAIDCLQQALAIHQETGDRRGEGWALGYLGLAHRDLGRFEEAMGYLQQALAMAREVGHRYGEGLVLRSIGTTHIGLRRFEEAIDCLQQALAIHQETGDRYNEAWSLRYLGLGFTFLYAQGMEAALACWQEALTIFTELGVPEADEIRILLARTESPPAG